MNYLKSFNESTKNTYEEIYNDEWSTSVSKRIQISIGLFNRVGKFISDISFSNKK